MSNRSYSHLPPSPRVVTKQRISPLTLRAAEEKASCHARRNSPLQRPAYTPDVKMRAAPAWRPAPECSTDVCACEVESKDCPRGLGQRPSSPHHWSGAEGGAGASLSRLAQ
eukprot:3064236-Prymnesium_polylepis.1